MAILVNQRSQSICELGAEGAVVRVWSRGESESPQR
jgi:hypothetical protein